MSKKGARMFRPNMPVEELGRGVEDGAAVGGCRDVDQDDALERLVGFGDDLWTSSIFDRSAWMQRFVVPASVSEPRPSCRSGVPSDDDEAGSAALGNRRAIASPRPCVPR